MFHTEGLTFSGEDNPLATLQLQMLASFAQFERALISERATEGHVPDDGVFAGVGEDHSAALVPRVTDCGFLTVNEWRSWPDRSALPILHMDPTP